MKIWYLRQSRNVFKSVLEANFGTFEKQGHWQPRPVVRAMRTRWGGLSPNGLMTLNPPLVEAPKACIEYVIVHELCRLVHNDHSPEFWRLLGRLLPDWENRKQRLEKTLVN